MIVQKRNFGKQSALRFGINEPKHDYGSHIHEFSEVLYVLDGSIESTVDGKTALLRTGDLAVIPPLKVHSTFTPESCRLAVFVLSNDFLLDFIPHDELFSGYSAYNFTPSPQLTAYLNEKFIKAVIEFRTTQSQSSYRTTKACVHAILDEFTQTVELCPTSVQRNILADVILYLNEHYKENISLSSVSKALGYAPGYISHCLEDLPQMNFATLLNSIRIETAKNLLLTKQYTNLEIAFECGFSCERSFYRAFLRIVGMTPKEYVNSKR